MSHVDLVFFMFKLHFEGEGVIKATTLPFHRVLVVTDIFSLSVPADSAGAGRFFGRVEQWFLALVIARVWLDQIYYIELVAGILSDIRHSEVEPLSVGRGLDIVF